MVPAYAGLLGSMGLAFLLHTAYLLPITAITLVVVIAALGFRAKRRRGYGPFLLGVLASVLLLIGKFALQIQPATYLGIGLLILASVWNSWRSKTIGNEPVRISKSVDECLKN